MNTLDTVRDMLAKEFDLAEASLDPSAPFDQLGMDSLTLTECLFLVEDKFDIRIDSADAAVRTLQELADMIDRLVATKAVVLSN